MLIGINTFIGCFAVLGLLPSIFFLLLSCDPSQNPNIEKVKITTDKLRYDSGHTVRIKINNQSEQTTYIWIGPCSFKLERYNGNAWEVNSNPWSGCPLCGHAREIPHPLFLYPGASKEIEWDQLVTWCEKEVLKTGSASGRFRFVFRYTKDEPGCHLVPDPLECWLNYHDKIWHSAYSNEFNIIEHNL